MYGRHPSRSLVALFALALLTSFRAIAEEPPQADSSNNVDLSATEFALLGLRSSHAPLYVDLVNTLLIPNGLGIDVASPEPSLRAQLALGQDTGLVVTAVPDESNGAKAGLQIHDVLVELNDQPIATAEKLRDLLNAADGQTIKLRVLRQGKRVDLDATAKNPLVARLATKNKLWTHLLNAPADEEPYRIGVTLSEADETLRTQLRLAAGEGLVVTEVIADSPAAKASVETHDVLIVLDGQRLTTVEAINSQIQEIKDRSVELRLLRGGKELSVRVAPRKEQKTLIANQVVVWDTQQCRVCHYDAHAHFLTAQRLRAAHSAWSDGNRLWGFSYNPHQQSVTASADNSPPQQQIEALKTHLAEMQKALSALESALKPAEPKDK